ncbi:glycosyltransferase family 4 protein [Pseudarthrobacter sp. N5]|uniref:glycosyltransferase family 4 protein n=1 Tax=Pseudarthrobacter sp. N5 TaxID=3418416 RepID=UPI003CF48CCD
MKILMITNNYIDRTRGGVELHVYNLAQALAKQGHEVQIARTSPGPGIYDDGGDLPLHTVLGHRREVKRGASGRLQKIRIVRFAANFAIRIETAIRAGRILRSDPEFLKSFDVVHHHDFITSAIISRIIKPLDVTQVWTNHLGEFLILRRVPLLGGAITRALTGSFVHGIGPSAELSDQATVSCPIKYIPNGVDTDAFVPLTDEHQKALRAKLGWDHGHLVAIVPRRWAPTKGVVFAAQAMSSPNWPTNCRVVFAGAGESDFPEYSTEIRRALDKTPISYEIVDSLSMSEMAEALQGADLCIIPSLMEATSLSALESMAAGLPVIGTRVGGLPQIIDEGVNGFLVPPMDADSIASAVAAISGLDSRERHLLGATSRARIAATYSWMEIARQTSQIYNKVTA